MLCCLGREALGRSLIEVPEGTAAATAELAAAMLSSEGGPGGTV